MRRYRLAVASVATLTLFACSHVSINQKIDQKLAESPKISKRSDLDREAALLIQTDPHLSADQKTKLKALADSTRQEIDILSLQSLKLRSLLVRELAETEYDHTETDEIKNRLRDTEDKKLNVLFDSIDQANSIMGREIPDHQKKVDDYFSHIYDTLE